MRRGGDWVGADDRWNVVSFLRHFACVNQMGVLHVQSLRFAAWAVFTAFVVFTIPTCNAWKPDRVYKGIVYKPLPKGVDPLRTEYLLDSDLYNSDFSALWGIDSTQGVISRNDISLLAVCTLHLLNWSRGANRSSKKAIFKKNSSKHRHNHQHKSYINTPTRQHINTKT
jgi:hypothetical protein